MADGVNVYSGQPGNWELVEQIPLAYEVGYAASITVNGVESELVALPFPIATLEEKAEADAPAAGSGVIYFGTMGATATAESEPEEPVEIDSD